MVEEFSEVVLLHDLPESGLRAGDVGVVVEAFSGGSTTVPGYIVEFMSMTGETVAVLDVTADAVRPVTSGDMPQARSFTRSS